MNGACNSKHFLVPPPGPGEMLKGQISLNYNNKMNFKDFIPKIVCCFTDKSYKNMPNEIFVLMPRSYPRGLEGPGVPRG